MTGKNMVIISGYIGQDVELKSTASGKQVVRASLGTPFGFGDKKRTIWVKFEAWEKTAQFLSNWAKKGTALTIVGHLDVKEWQEDEKRRTDMVVIVDQAEFALAAKDGQKAEPAATVQYKEPVQTTLVGEDEDLPF